MEMSVQNQTSVALLLTMHLLMTEANNTNCVISPLSIHFALSLISSGANGATLSQLLSFLRYNSIGSLASLASQLVHSVLADGSASGGPKILTGTRMLVKKSLSLKPTFVKGLQTSYNALALPADFVLQPAAVTTEVNSWVAKQTNGLINNILPPNTLNAMTVSVIANALYFKGIWSSKFNVADTKAGDFHLLKGGTISVPFMTSANDQYVSAYDGFKVLRLPYSQGKDKRQFSMYMFLPDAVDGLPLIIQKVLSDSTFLSQRLPQQQVAVGNFRIPRFKLTFGFEASGLLEGMGLTAPFTNGVADFSGMFTSPVGRSFFISKIFHKAFIEVNEEGTVAAAATAGVGIAGGLPTQKIDFVADHPFLFIIREDLSGAVLFTGQVLQPTGGP